MPIVEPDVIDRRDQLDTSVVEDQVDGPEPVGDLLGGRVDRRAVGDVERQGERGAPAAVMRAASASRLSARRAATATVAPRVASRNAVASPIPLEAPVTTATRKASGVVVMTVDMLFISLRWVDVHLRDNRAEERFWGRMLARRIGGQVGPP